MVTVFNLEKHIMCQFVEYTYKVKLAKFQLPSFRRSAVANKNSLGGSRYDRVKVIGIRPLAPVQNSVSLKPMQPKTLNFVINLPDVENITK